MCMRKLIGCFVFLIGVLAASAQQYPPYLLYTLVGGVPMAATGSGSVLPGGMPPGFLCYGLNGSGQPAPCVFSGGSMVYPAAGVAASTGSAWRTPLYTDITALWSSCSGTQYLGADGVCHTASGSFSALSGDATSTSTGGATVVHGINSVLLSSLSSCILYNTTGTGVPSCATAAELGTLANIAQYGVVYSAGTTSALTEVTPPTTNGFYFIGHNVTGSAAVAPTATASTALPAGTAIGTLDTGTPTLTPSANLWTSNVPVSAPSLLSGTPSAGVLAALPTGAHGMAVDETSTVGVPAAGVDYLRADATSHRIKQSLNGGAEVNVPIPSEIPAAQVAANLASSGSTGVMGVLPVANGGTGSAVADTTFTVSTSTTINANSCTPDSGSGGTSVTMTNLTSAMTLAITPNADITNTTGWGNPAAGVLYVTLAPGSGAFTYHVCNNTASNITTNGAATFNVSAR